MAKKPVVHLSPVWQERANFVIFADIAQEGEVLPRELEQLWAQQLSENEFEICCVPFFLYGIALGDVVTTKPGLGKQYLLSSTVSRSGRQVVRLNFTSDADLQEKDQVLQHLRDGGRLFEWYSENLLAVDSPSAAETKKLEPFFIDLEKRGIAKYEFSE